jgi:hypothetical protein
MADRYTKAVLSIIGVALTVIAVESIARARAETHAQTKPQLHCVWTHILDQGEPNIGENGNVDFSKGQNWKRLSDEGWVLKAVSEHNYVFERCEP